MGKPRVVWLSKSTVVWPPRPSHHHSLRAFLGSQMYFSDQQRKNDNVVKLRSLRRLPGLLQGNDGINYSYREGKEDQQTVAQVWGNKAVEEGGGGPETWKGDAQTYVPFFEEVQHRMDAKHDDTANKSKLDVLFGALKNVRTTADITSGSLSFKRLDERKQPLSPETSVVTNLQNGKSVFDAFPPPEPTSPRNPNAFNEEAYGQYIELIDEVVVQDGFTRNHTRRPNKEEVKRPVIEWLRRDERLVQCDFPGGFQFTTQSDSTLSSGDFRAQLKEQQDRFCQASGFDSKQLELALVALTGLGKACAKKGKSLPLEVAWEKIKESGLVLSMVALNNYLYTCTVYASRHQRSLVSNDSSVGSFVNILDANSTDAKFSELGTSTTLDLDTTAISEEMAIFHNLLYGSTEQTLTVQVKAMVARGMGSEAEDMLESCGSVNLRLRTFLPILHLYQRQGEISAALTLFDKIRNKHGLLLQPESYISLIAAAAESGYFSQDAVKDTEVTDLGFNPTPGPGLFDELVTAMAEDVLEISSASARRLYSAFSTAFQDTYLGRNLERLHPLTPLQLNNDAVDDDELVVGRVKVDTTSGRCLRTDAKLRLITLDANHREQMQQSLVRLSEEQYENYSKEGKKVKVDPHEEMLKFTGWLDEREGQPFTAIVDGANVGYYMQNFEHGRFNYHQIQFMVEALEQLGETPLIILPAKYCQKFFKMRRGYDIETQKLEDGEIDILQRLARQGKIYQVPAYCLDDFYWMVASVSDQRKSRAGKSLEVPPDDPSGRWPGTRPMLITNDQMRDHKLELMEPRLFRRWFASHIVNYNFTGFVGAEKFDTRIGYSPPDFFSREIQANPTLNHNGDQSGIAWHFPVSDWNGSERFCVRIPTSG